MSTLDKLMDFARRFPMKRENKKLARPRFDGKIFAVER